MPLRCTIGRPMSATILIVEDEYAVARGIQYALEQEGYQVTVAGSGEEALEVVAVAPGQRRDELHRLADRRCGVFNHERAVGNGNLCNLSLALDDVDRIDYRLGERQVVGCRRCHNRDLEGVVASTADHGVSFGEHGVWWSSAGLYPQTLRVPLILNVRRDPYERGPVTSNTYYDWLLDRAYLLVPAQAYVGNFLTTFQEFPPRQKAASFSLDQVMEKMQMPAGAH